MKVLITGPWQEASNNYSCLFDQISVPASLIQPGVLRCYCPGEEAASRRGAKPAKVPVGKSCHYSGPQFPQMSRNGSRFSYYTICWGSQALCQTGSMLCWDCEENVMRDSLDNQ